RPRRHREAAARARTEHRLSSLLSGRAQPLLCEELALRARVDLHHRRLELAAIELDRALSAAAVELRQPMPARAQELEELHHHVAELAADALRGRSLRAESGETLEAAARRLESALRARVADVRDHR
ncbi:MAG: hypothetical protein ACYCYN_09515, partial [Solirubrobacteraceae bacterium]